MINAKRMGKILMVAAALFVGLIGTRGNGADKPLTNPTAEKLGYFLVACFSNERGAAVFNDLKASLPPDAEFGEHAGKKGVLLRNGPVILTPPENQCAEGFHFSFTMTPLWMGNDAKYHPIISFECVTKDGGKCWLSLAKWPTTVTPLYFAVGTPKWKGAISADNPLIWVAGDSHHIAGGLGTNGLFISIDGAPQVHKKIDPASSVVKIERIVLGTVPQDLGELHAQYWISGSAQDYRADFWLRDLYIGNSAPQEASAPYVNPPWRVAPVPNWVVSPDIPMNCAGNLQCYAKNLKGQDVFIVIECPEGIVPGDFMTFPAGSQTAMVLSGSKVVAHEGRNYYRRRYQLPPYILVCPELAKKPWPFYLCLSTDLPYGTETDVWLGIEWEGGAQAPLRIPIRVAKLGPPPVLKRLSVGMSLGRTDLLAQGDYTAFVKRVGLNFLDLWHDDRTPGVCSPGVNPSADEAIARCMDAGILPCLAIHGSTLLRWGVPPEARCKDIDGKPFAGGDGRSRCPSDRGPEYRKDMEYCRNAAARGVGLTHDLECAGFGIRHACFCERCIEKFKNYLKTRHPDMAFVSPREFEREPAKNAKLHEIWREFISAQGSEWMYDYYKAAGEGLQMARNKPRNPLFLIYDEGLWDSAIDLSEAFARPRNSLRFFAG
ncbi:MAG: hypothetical protein Q7J98_07630, partial [Kiritimatiellia bacterium]|nr:hypothetical protein [Kiritimatiellia bacterium]